MTCPICGATITADERGGKTFRGVLCQICLEKAEQCAPDDDPPFEPYQYPQP